MNQYELWKKHAPKTLLKKMESMTAKEVMESFECGLKFGTAGIRAKMGIGSSKLNVFTVRQISMGLAKYLNLNKNQGGSRVCISYDNRLNSRLFACQAARVLAKNGITAIITTTLMPTPYLSFITRYYKADAGIMITASHNPKEYNGYKVYASDGCQLVDETADKLADCIDAVELDFSDDNVQFSQLIKDKKVIQTSAKRAYLDAIKGNLQPLMQCSKNMQDGFKVCYTPLNGAGSVLVGEILQYIGAKVDTVKQQEYPDPCFTSCQNPNPESDCAFVLAIKCAKENDSNLIIATDPDCDRVGVMARHNGEYHKLSGNQIGVLLCDYLLRHDKQRNKNSKPLVVRTVVSTALTDRIAESYDAKIKKVLTGFKYIGQQISAAENKDDLHFLFGFEESCGYLSGTHVRDKDAVEASALIVLMAKEYHSQNKSLIDAMNNIYERFGYYLHNTVSYKFEGLENKKIVSIMEKLRKDGIDGIRTISKVDYLLGYEDLPKTNMIELCINSGTIIIRPSGTEPLIKVYINLVGSQKFTAQEFQKIKNLCDLFFC